MDIIIIIIGSGGVVDTIVGTNNIVIPGGFGGSGISRSGSSFVANHSIIIGMTILCCVGIIILVESRCLVSTAVAVGMSSTSTAAAAVLSKSIRSTNHVVVVIIDVVVDVVITKICGIFSTGLFLMQRSCHGFVK